MFAAYDVEVEILELLADWADFASAKERFTKAGVESARPIDWGDHDCLYFLDPDGNLLEIVSYR